MKKIIYASLIILLIGSISFGSDQIKSRKMLVQFNGNLLFFADGRFVDVYGSMMVHPGLKLSYDLSKKIFLSLGYDYFFVRGSTPETQAESESTQHFIKLSGGYQGQLSDKLKYRGEAGVFYASYKDEVFDLIDTGSAIGFLIEGSLIYRLTKKFRALVFLGFHSGFDTFEGTKIIVGGFRTGIGFGISF